MRKRKRVRWVMLALVLLPALWVLRIEITAPRVNPPGEDMTVS